MRVFEVMTKNAECIRPDATVRDAAGRMRDLDVGSLPVCDNDRIVGVVTDRDIAVRSVAEGHDPRADHVRDIMTNGVTYCFEDQDIREAADLMREKQIRRLPVLSRAKRLVGIVSLGDLAVQSGDEKLGGHTLEGISEPAMPNR
jgi:CBS domain-containing protein